VHEVPKGIASDVIWFVVSEYRWGEYQERNRGRCQRMWREWVYSCPTDTTSMSKLQTRAL
jgi:hypothetical protein